MRHRKGTKGGVWWVLAFALLLASMPGAAISQDAPAPTPPATGGDFQDFSELSIEDMLNTTVTSSSKMEQSVIDAPNAIAVITAEDIRRAGALSLPEALRLAPGVYVAQISGNEWVVAIGGFALGAEARQVLVQVDGVTVYITDSGRVDFDTLALSVDEVAKIEVIRGPGGVLYGANAVAGVISITTFDGRNGPRAAVRVVGGSQGERYTHATGAVVSPNGVFASRVSVTEEQDQGLGVHQGQHTSDYQQTLTGSIRNTVNLQDGLRIDLDARFKGGDLAYPALTASMPDTIVNVESTIFRGKVEQVFDNGGQWNLQAYSWRHNRRQYNDGVPEKYIDATTNDLEFQGLVPFEAGGRHRLAVGGGYRWNDVQSIYMEDGEQTEDIANVYLHDEWVLSEQWIADAGVKWEDSNLTDPTWSWRGALLFKPTKNQSFRVAAANSYRQPSLSERFINVDLPLPAGLAFTLPFWPAGKPQSLVLVRGDEDLKPEQVVTYEAGYRALIAESLYLDLSYAYKQYDDLISFIQSGSGFYVNVPTGPPPAPVIPVGPVGMVYSYGSGGGGGVTQTAEAELDYRVNPQLRLTAIYGLVDIDIEKGAFQGYEINTPKNFGRLGLNYTHPRGFMFDLSGNYYDLVQVANFENLTTEPIKIEAYWGIDARIAQRVKMKNGEMEVGLIGKNLAEEWHDEYVDYSGATAAFPVRRSFYGYLEYRI